MSTLMCYLGHAFFSNTYYCNFFEILDKDTLIFEKMLISIHCCKLFGNVTNVSTT